MRADALTAARDAYGRRAWAEARELLRRADDEAPLDPEDLERLAVAAYRAGRDDEHLATLARAHHARL
jgi:hypothetical protein